MVSGGERGEGGGRACTLPCDAGVHACRYGSTHAPELCCISLLQSWQLGVAASWCRVICDGVQKNAVECYMVTFFEARTRGVTLVGRGEGREKHVAGACAHLSRAACATICLFCQKESFEFEMLLDG